jgi:Na+-driven multidrug efflux pump
MLVQALPPALTMAVLALLQVWETAWIGRAGAEILAGVLWWLPALFFLNAIAAAALGNATAAAIARASGPVPRALHGCARGTASSSRCSLVLPR